MTSPESPRIVRSIEELMPLIGAMPYAQTLGFSVIRDGDELVGRLGYIETQVGNAAVPALHGGALSALMELTAACKLLMLTESARMPKTATITVEYLRPAQLMDTFARATIAHRGRRFANLRIVAYQDNPSRPVAVATTHFLLVG